MEYKKPLSIVMFTILATSSFTFLGAFTLFPTQQAEAQGLQLRISAAERPQFENHFFGGQIVQVIIDDPGATDPDESTVGLVINGFNSKKVHLSDGLWYTFFAEDQGFAVLADILSDNVRDQRIAVSKAVNDAGAALVIGGATFNFDVGAADSFIAEVEVDGFPHVEINQVDLMPTLPPPFFEAAGVINPDLRIGGVEGDGACAALGGLSTGFGAEGDADCDWPYIRLIGLEETSTVEIRAGSASVTLIFDDFADSIVASLDRTTDYPLRAEVINAFTDFMWNFNPVEEDAVYFALNRDTGDPEAILIQPVPLFDPASNSGGVAQNFPDVFGAFTSSPGMEFDERQVQELDQEGVQSLGFIYGFLPGTGLVTFVAPPVVQIFENTQTINPIPGKVGFDAAPLFDAAGGVVVNPGGGAVLPVVPMFEGDPNVSIFDNTVEAAGGRASLFTAANDRVASFDYFDIINSSPMTTHDGFTSVDREVYDSADRSIFTVTDPDQNLRSKISEEPSGRESNSFIRVGAPFPLVNTRNAAAGISNTAIDTVTRMWAATFLQAGDGIIVDALTFGIDAPVGPDGGPGAAIFADVDNDGIIDMGAGAGEGTERFHADDDDIVDVGAGLSDENRNLALSFIPPLIGGSPATSIIVDTTLTIDNINDFVDIQDITREEILGQVRVDSLFDGTCGVVANCGADQFENFLVQVAEIDTNGAAAGGILGEDVAGGVAGLGAGAVVDVRMPRYNLVHIDLTDLQSQFNLGDAVVKIDAIDPTCIDPDAADAFGITCVHASQVVDFGIVETVVADTDAVAITGDDYNDPVKDVLDVAVAEGGIDVWSSQVADADEPIDDQETGFDRDPQSGSRVGVGAFRALDLARVADLNDDGLANNSALGDRIRVTLLLLSSGDAPSVLAGFATDEPIETILAQTQRVVIDIGGLGTVFDPAPTDATPDNLASAIGNSFENMVYRLELDEEGSNSSIFTGRADFMTFIQLDTVADVLNDIVLTGDPLKIWLPNRFIPPNRLAFNNLDEDIVQFFREVSATFIYETRDGNLEWDRSSFSFGQDAFLTVTDEDLNRRPDATERYNLPLDSFVFFELGKQRVCSEINPLISGDPAGAAVSCAFGQADSFFNQIDATLLETGPNTGTFVAQITMPRAIMIDATPGTPGSVPTSVVTQQQDLEANYIDIRDRSSVRQEFDDITNIRTTLGDVVLDRAAYPPGALMFVEIHDNDFNTDVDIRENINLVQIVITNPTTAASGWGAQVEGTQLVPALPGDCDTALEFVGAACTNAAPILEITIFRTGVGRLVTLLPAGLLDVTEAGGVPAAAALDDRFGTGINTGAARAILPILDRSGIPVTTALETGPNTGIFEFEVQLPGPAFDVGQFPVDLPDILTAGTVAQPVIDANQPIQATYFDPADESGETEDEEELATFLFNTARLRTDKLEYGLGEPVDIIVEEPDFNRDSRSIDEISFSILDIITDKFDTEDEENNNFACVVDEGPAAILELCDAGNFGAAANMRTNLTNLRETGFNTGVFVVQLEELLESLVDRGEDVELIYRDQTPSGGGAEIRIEYEFLVVEILPEIIFDKEEYTPFDEFIVSIISPDSNQDPDRIEQIRPLISSSTASLGRQSFPETGPNTGIFEEDFDLTPDPTRFPGDLQAIREDGVTVEFRIDEDTVATKSVFVNYHVGQVMFDKDAFRMNERGVLRVIDPDANRNPDTIDTTSVRFWSTTDRGGLLVVLRETGDRTGIFEEIITFTPDEESTGTRLRVSEGDTITAKFTDNTLPAPAALDADETFTVEVEELFASALIGSIVEPLSRAVAAEPELVDAQGNTITDVTVGSQVLIQSEITNSQTKKQPFAYIVQIKDADDVTVSLSWVTGELPAKDSLSAAQSWIPDAAGDYTVEIFVWLSVENPDPLSPTRTIEVSVS